MFRVSGRPLKILIGIIAAAIVLGGVLLAVLPEIVRRVAIAQVPKLTGRGLLLDDVDLNVFTDHLALKLALTPVAAPRDLESLKEQELTLRIQRLQKDRKLPDFGAAVAKPS